MRIEEYIKKGKPFFEFPFGLGYLSLLILFRRSIILLFLSYKGRDICDDVLQNSNTLAVLGVALWFEEPLYCNFLSLFE